MTTAPRRLRVVPAPPTPEAAARCEVVCQATLNGSQETSVRALTPVSGGVGPMIALRVGRVLILLSDRGALRSIREACRSAEELAEQAFGE